MKILFQSRVDLFNPRGGDTFQIEYTKAVIEKLDPSVMVDIRPEVKVKDIDEYDIVHLFNLDWVCETYIQAKWAKKHNKPVVLSAIHHSEEEMKRFEKEERYGIRRIYNFVIPWQSTRDLWKNIYRSIFNPKKIYPTLVQFFKGIRNQQREIVEVSDIVLVQTDREAEDIKKDFNTRDFEWKKVVNGVNIDVFSKANANRFTRLMNDEYNVNPSRILLAVGRIEPRKNQLKIIKAFLELKNERSEFAGWVLVFIGAPNKHHPEYVWRFGRATKKHKDVYYIGSRSQEIVASAMSMDGVFLNPSWLETTGLVALEAAIAGMPVVVSGNRVREYLGNYVEYCDPGNVESIKNAILKADRCKKISRELIEKIEREYSWERTARQTISVYKNLLNN